LQFYLTENEEDEMKCSKTLLAVLAAGALSAATAVPAMAFENEFHGYFNTYFNDSNFTINNGGPSVSDIGQPTKATDNANFFETRLRMNYTAKLTDDLKIVSRFETNYNFWGNSSYTSGSSRPAGRTTGGALGSRGVNLETKQVYLDLKTPSYNTEFKVGMQPWTDDFSGIFVDGDMAGVTVSHDYSKGGVSAGFFRWDDADNNPGNPTYGKQTRDLYVLNGKYEVSKDFKIGGAYYFLNADLPNGNSTDVDTSKMNFQMHMLGLNGEGQLGPVTLNGFLVTQLGHDHLSNRDIASYAGSLGAKMAIGPGTARTNFLYTSGDDGKGGTDHSFRVGSFESDYYDNHLTILGRNQYAMVNDNAVIFDANNGGMGSIFGTVGYDFPINKEFSGSANLGFAAVAEDNASKPIRTDGTAKANNSNFLGTEINAEVKYKMNTFTTFTVCGGYVFLGDYFKHTAPGGNDPENLYDLKLIATVAF